MTVKAPMIATPPKAVRPRLMRYRCQKGRVSWTSRARFIPFIMVLIPLDDAQIVPRMPKETSVGLRLPMMFVSSRCKTAAESGGIERPIASMIFAVGSAMPIRSARKPPIAATKIKNGNRAKKNL